MINKLQDKRKEISMFTFVTSVESSTSGSTNPGDGLQGLRR